MSSGVSPGPGSLKYNSSVQLWQWSVEAVAGSDVATCHSRVCPGPGIEPHEEEAAASVTRLRPACSMVCSCRLQACSGSGHHLECPPAVLQCAAAQQQQRDLAPTNSSAGAGSVAKSWLFSQNRTELAPRTLKMEHSSFLFFLVDGIAGCFLALGITKYYSASSSGSR